MQVVQACLVLCCACTGQIDEDTPRPSSPAARPSAAATSAADAAHGGSGAGGSSKVAPPSANAGGGAAPPAAVSCNANAPDPGPDPLRRLTRTQYLNSVHDLVGDIAGLEAALGASSAPSEFGL
ncbi:MAG: hypothetical protein RL701_3427, partial [Pseudomonadota bacterium]